MCAAELKVLDQALINECVNHAIGANTAVRESARGLPNDGATSKIERDIRREWSRRGLAAIPDGEVWTLLFIRRRPFVGLDFDFRRFARRLDRKLCLNG
jgi:hypothetical protein